MKALQMGTKEGGAIINVDALKRYLKNEMVIYKLGCFNYWRFIIKRKNPSLDYLYDFTISEEMALKIIKFLKMGNDKTGRYIRFSNNNKL